MKKTKNRKTKIKSESTDEKNIKYKIKSKNKKQSIIKGQIFKSSGSSAVHSRICSLNTF